LLKETTGPLMGIEPMTSTLRVTRRFFTLIA